MIDKPGPWGTGPFALVEGHSSISTRCAIQRPEPFACSWLIEAEDRSERLVLEANGEHWNSERIPRIKRVVFRNELSPAEALDLCVSGEGEVDIVTEVSPADAVRVLESEHTELVPFDANRMMVGIFNRFASDVPLEDRRVREALNLAVDRDRVIAEGLGGYANPLPAMSARVVRRLPGGAGAAAARSSPRQAASERGRVARGARAQDRHAGAVRGRGAPAGLGHG